MESENLSSLIRLSVSDGQKTDSSKVVSYIGINNKNIYYIPITDTTLELSVFWPSDTESRINELRFSESISLYFKTWLTPATCFCGDVT